MKKKLLISGLEEALKSLNAYIEKVETGKSHTCAIELPIMQGKRQLYLDTWVGARLEAAIKEIKEGA